MADLKERVQELLDTSINPAVAGHGGYIELLDVKENTAYIRMAGGKVPSIYGPSGDENPFAGA